MATVVDEVRPQCEPARPRLAQQATQLPDLANAGARLTPNAALAILIGVSAQLRLIWAGGIGLCNDEAYHYLFTVYPDWSYFDHPPMTMWIEWLGLGLCGGWVHPLSLRLGFVLLMAGSTWIMARLTARWYGGWAGFYAALLLNLTVYYGAAGAFALPDLPLLFFGLLTMWALTRALVAEPNGALPWIWVGLALAGALLSKYHAVFFPAAVLVYIALTPAARPILRRPGPYLALAIGSLGFLPVVIWNAEHGWLSFAFQGGRAFGTSIRMSGFVSTLLGPALYLLPGTWILLWWILLTRLKNWRTISPVERLLVCLAIVPIGFFLAVSPLREMLPHWSLIGFVALLPIGGAWWAKRAALRPSRARVEIAGVTALLLIAAGVTMAHARFGVFTFPGKDPLTEMSGWDSLGLKLETRGLVGQPRTFLLTDRWYDSGQLAFAIRGKSPVLCYNYGDAHGFAQWHNPDDWLGWDGILITPRECDKEMTILGMFFEKIELIDEVELTRGGKPFRPVRIWRCVNQQRPFPFRYGDKDAEIDAMKSD